MGTSKTFDVPAVDDARQRITDTALDTGRPFVDSSPMYGNAERILGATLGARRAEAIVATKVWTPDDDEAERQIDASLAFFGGHVEVFQVHNLVALADPARPARAPARPRRDRRRRRHPLAGQRVRRAGDGDAHRPGRGDPGAVQPARARGRGAHLPARPGPRARRDPDAPVRRRRARRPAPSAGRPGPARRVRRDDVAAGAAEVRAQPPGDERVDPGDHAVPSGWPRTPPPATGRGSGPTRRRSSNDSPADVVATAVPLRAGVARR